MHGGGDATTAGRLVRGLPSVWGREEDATAVGGLAQGQAGMRGKELHARW